MRRFACLLPCLLACGSDKPSNGTHDMVDAPPGMLPSDGSTNPQADAPVATGTDPADDGELAVTMTTASIPGAAQGRTLAATVFAPTTGPTPRPLVIVSPGFQMSRTQYASYAHHLATWGFVAITTDYAESGFFIDHARIAADVPAVIDWALAQSALAVDGQRIATAGHSLGGKISVFGATLDARIKAVVGWDPVDSNNPSVAPEKMATLAAAVAVVGETTNGSGGGMPCAPAADNFTAFYAAAKTPALAMTVLGADHMDWVDDPSCGVCGFCSPGTADPALVRKLTRRLDVAWLRRQLLADAAMDPWLDSPPEASAVSIQRK
ncbi:MAG TPA: CocE/NonD family hydrolase [Kofleriaceae bacterium]